MSNPYFKTELKPADGTAGIYADLQSATDAANTLALGNIGAPVTVWEARREAIAPAPTATDADISEV